MSEPITGYQSSYSQERLEEIAQWVRQTCLLFGSQTSTAYIVAGYFVRGLERGQPWSNTPAVERPKRGRPLKQTEDKGS